MTENRRYPRISHVTSRQIVRLDGSQTPQKNIILTQNLSACGIKFTTNEFITPASHFLIYLNNVVVNDVIKDTRTFLKSGDYFLAKVAWCKELKRDYYEIGASFLEKNSCKARDIDTFTELVNISMLDLLPETDFSDRM
ncbi:MAG: hypothetical protein HQM16_19325 [Deltaproteobacteria bacterium]|nr:hypothetical protein [Deltaproteobacteria bacterium]